MIKKDSNNLVSKALEGDGDALDYLLSKVQDLIFNLSLRMLGTVADAEDATQDIFVKIMTNLNSFRDESKFETWVFRLSKNYLINYKKTIFAQYPLNFDYYLNDIKDNTEDFSQDLLTELSRKELAQEFKKSCTNVLLQCFAPQTRCIFILGTMFKVDSRIASEILGISPDNYRQKLSRARKKMAGFLSYHCRLIETGCSNCEQRIGFTIKQKRIDTNNLSYSKLDELNEDVMSDCQNNMEILDEMSEVFSDLPMYKSPVSAKSFLHKLLNSSRMREIQKFH